MQRGAIVTGASSGIGLAVTEMLAGDGYGVTMTARRSEKLAAACEPLQAEGLDVQAVAGDISDESVVKDVVAQHRTRYGRCDVLMNNAGMGVFEPVGRITAKRVDQQIGVNLRATAFLYRECLEMLASAAAEHGQALVVNVSSMTAKQGEEGLSVYAAVKAAVIQFTESMHLELSGRGIKSTVFLPGFVDTPMADGVKGDVRNEDMIRPEDLALAVRFMLRLSHATVVPDLLFIRPRRS